MTPEIIVKKIMSFEMSEEEAVKRINILIENIREELTGTMGETEWKYFVDQIKRYYKAHNHRVTGAEKEMKTILLEVIQKCGFEDFYEIKNTKENRTKIEEELENNRNHYFG